jgi:ABC-type bacteriocin/lantibiotic exporter with double-glycine peptidase domain
MRYQEYSHTCGPSAVVNALKCFGKHYREKTIEKLYGTTEEEGTNEEKLIAGIRALGWQATALELGNGKEAFHNLWLALSSAPVLLCVDSDNHWVTATGKIGRRVIIVDPKNTVANRKENGVHVVSAVELIRRWRNSDNQHYGLVIHRPQQKPLNPAAE